MNWPESIIFILTVCAAFVAVRLIIKILDSPKPYFDEEDELEKFNSSGRYWSYQSSDEFEYVKKFSRKVEGGDIVFVVPKKPKSKNLRGTTWYFDKYTKHYTLRDDGRSCNCSGHALHKERCYHMRMIEEARIAGVFDFKITAKSGSRQIFYVPLRSDNAAELTRVEVIKKSKNKEIKYVCETCVGNEDLVCKHAEAVIAAAQSGEIVIR